MKSFCSAKASLIFSIKNISVFGFKVEFLNIVLHDSGVKLSSGKVINQ